MQLTCWITKENSKKFLLFSQFFTEFESGLKTEFELVKAFLESRVQEGKIASLEIRMNEMRSELKREICCLETKMDEQKNELKQEIACLKTRMDEIRVDELKREIASFQIRMNELKSELKREVASFEVKMNELKSELKQEIERVDINRPEASFRFEITNVSEFLKASLERNSEKIWCRGLQWSIKAKSSLGQDGSKRLEIHLVCHNDDLQKMSCNVDCKLTLFSHLGNIYDKVKYVRNNYAMTMSKSQDSWGYGEFISHRDLTNPKNGYIKDNKILLGVKLQVGPVIRES